MKDISGLTNRRRNEKERLSWRFGIPELDELVGELPSGYVVLIEGKPGSGKTSFTIATICRNMDERGSSVFYVTTNETLRKLKELAKSVGCDLDKFINNGKLRILEAPMFSDRELIEFISNEVTKAVIQGYDTVVIDSVTPLIKLLDKYAEKRAWLHTIIYKLASLQGANVLMICDNLLNEDPDVALLEYLVDVVIKLDYKPNAIFPRSLSFFKFRTRPIPSIPVYFEFVPTGIRAINVVSKKLCKYAKPRRKTIKITEKPAMELFGNQIKPGTQIGIIVKYPATSPGYLIKYLLYKLGLEAINEKIDVGLIYFGNDEEIRFLYETGNKVMELLRDRIALISIDLMWRQLPHYMRDYPVRPEGLDVLFVMGYEKLINLYGMDELSKMLSTYHYVDKELGITSIRLFRTSSSYPDPPPSLILLGDLVIEATLNEQANRFDLKVLKGAHTIRPITISDTDLLPAIKDLENEILRRTMKENH